MKKILILSLMLCLSIVLITSCKKEEKTTEVVNKPTTNVLEMNFYLNDSVHEFKVKPTDNIENKGLFFIKAENKIKNLFFVMLDVNNDTITKYNFSSNIGAVNAQITIPANFTNILLSKYPLRVKGLVIDNNNNRVSKTLTYILDYNYAPIITFQNIGSEVIIDTITNSYATTFVVNAFSEIKTLVVSQKDKNGNIVTLPITPVDYFGKTDFVGNFTATGFSTANAPYTISVEVMDKEEVIRNKSFTIDYPANDTNFTGNFWINKELGARSNSKGGYFGASTGMVYTMSTQAANIANIDIIFDDLTGAKVLKLYSPSALNVGGVTGYKVTKFKTSNLVFAEATDADLATITATDANIAIVVGGTYAFITEAGKKGLVKVNSIMGTGTSAVVKIDVKIQK